MLPTMSPLRAEMSEIEFIKAVLDEADCLLHLDVNKIYVNSVNHKYDALEFLHGLPVSASPNSHRRALCRGRDLMGYAWAM